MTPKPTAGGRFVAYYRVSTKEQDEAHRKPSETGGYSLGIQQEAVRAYVANAGGELVDQGEFTERESGYQKKTRPQLTAALARAREAGAVLVIAKLDRLARNVHFLSGLMEGGVEFIALDLPGANKFTLHIMAAVAEQESQRLSERTKAGVVKARERGAKLGGLRPHMLTANPAHLGGARRREVAIAHYRAHHVDELIAVLRDSKFSYERIAERLNARGNVRTSTGGVKWTATMVRNVHLMMRNAKAAGAA